MRWFVGLCAGAVLGLAASAIGCGGSYQPPPESGGSKGPEMKVTGATGQPVAASSSSMAQNSAPFVAPPTPSLVDAGVGQILDASTDQ
jgi:hypothetical protein